MPILKGRRANGHPIALTLPAAPSVATSYTMTQSASSGTTGTADTLTFAPVGGNWPTATITIVVSSGVSPSLANGSGGTLSGSVLTVPSGTNTSCTVSMTPSTAGTATISATNSAGMSNPSNLTYAATAPTTYATAYTTSLSSPSGGVGSAVMVIFTPTGGSWPIGEVITPTVSGVTGTFSPTTVSASGSGAVSSYFTPSAEGTASISSTTSPAMTNTSGARSYTVTASSSGSYTPLTGIAWSQPDPYSFSVWQATGDNIRPACGTFKPIGGTGPFVFSVDGAGGFHLLNADGNSSGASTVGWVEGPFSSGQLTTFTIQLSITDALGATVTQSQTITQGGSRPAIVVAANRTWPSNITPVIPAYAVDGSGTTSNPTVTDPSGHFSYDGFAHVVASGPVPAGSYPITLTGAGVTKNVTITIEAAVVSPMTWTQINQVSTSSLTGLIVGNIKGSTPFNSRVLTINDGTGSLAINATNGNVVLNATPPSGTLTFAVTETEGTASRTDTFSINVAAGSTLPATNMTMTANSFTNYFDDAQLAQRPVGTPSVTGFPDPSQVTWYVSAMQRTCWVMDNPNDVPDGTPRAGIGRPRFACNASTGAVVVQACLSDTTGTPGEWLELTATDGVRNCTQRFYVPVSPAAGPVYHVGRGMSTSAPAGTQGYEHLVDVLKLYQGWGGSGFSVPNTKIGNALAGGTIYIHYDTVAPDTYYVNDWDQNWNTVRAGLNGPLKLIGVVGPNGELPFIGGPKGSSNIAVGEKGLFTLNDGDFRFENLELGYIHMDVFGGDYVPGSSNAMALICRNSGTSGDTTIVNCDIHDSDNPLRSAFSDGQWAFNNVRLYNGAGCYQGNGNQHNAYLGLGWNVVANNLISYNTTGGHVFKIRAANGTFTDCRFYDGERGSQISAFDMPNGGNYKFVRCHFEKAPMANNPYLVQYNEEITSLPWEDTASQNYVKNLDFEDCTFTKHCPDVTGRFAINWCGQIGHNTGVPSTLTLTNAKFEGITSGNHLVINNEINPSHDFSANVVETGSTYPSTFTPLNLATPVSHDVGRPGWHDTIAWLNSNTDWPYFNARQIDPGTDYITIPASAAPGTVICSTMRAYGAPNYALSGNAQPDPLINPYTAGTQWAAGNNPVDYTGTSWGWATANYTITTNGDGTGTLAVGPSGLGSAGCDYILIRATPPAPHADRIVENGFFVIKT